LQIPKKKFRVKELIPYHKFSFGVLIFYHLQLQRSMMQYKEGSRMKKDFILVAFIVNNIKNGVR
jgi:hypothetical protein